MNYNFVDQTPAAGNNFYRLRQQDIYGKYSLSVIRTVSIVDAQNILVYPNPTEDFLSVSGLDADDYLELIDLTGRTVHRQTAQSNHISIDMSEFAAGTYQLRITSAASGLKGAFKVIKTTPSH